ncbi:MAG: hypothetical protein HQL82_03105 [Magnetococcales bacterium]|nr:hypothetical protein [Magnetococcales bacterium]
MRRHIGTMAILAGLGLVGALSWTGTAWAEGRNQISFADDVYPILHYRCLGCHQTGGPGTEQSGLNLETYEGVMKGTKHGQVVIPGSADGSSLIRLVTGDAAIRMPHNQKRLTSCEIDTLRRWILQGAKNN